MDKVRKDESGHIVVETIGTFIPLVLLMISILSLVNIVAVQARMHFALTQAAMTISVFSYSFEAIGISGEDSILGDINSTFDGISIFTGSNSNIGDSISLFENMTGFVKSGLAGYARDGLISPLVMKYITNEKISGGEFLERFGVRNIDFSSSALIDKNENVKLTVQYDVDYTFGALPLPFGPSLRITQTVVTKTWQSGSGMGYGGFNE